MPQQHRSHGHSILIGRAMERRETESIAAGHVGAGGQRCFDGRCVTAQHGCMQSAANSYHASKRGHRAQRDDMHGRLGSIMIFAIITNTVRFRLG